MEHIDLIAARMEEARFERGIPVAELARRIPGSPSPAPSNRAGASVKAIAGPHCARMLGAQLADFGLCATLEQEHASLP